MLDLERLSEEQRTYLREHTHTGRLSEEQRAYLREHVAPPQLELPLEEPEGSQERRANDSGSAARREFGAGNISTS
jgi:hypothetical protein